MDRKKLTWRVYRIESEEDLKRALAQYHTVTGMNPVRVRLSERASGDLLKWVERLGIEVVRAKDVLPWDVWLTDGAVVTEQLALFGGMR